MLMGSWNFPPAAPKGPPASSWSHQASSWSGVELGGREQKSPVRSSEVKWKTPRGCFFFIALYYDVNFAYPKKWMNHSKPTTMITNFLRDTLSFLYCAQDASPHQDYYNLKQGSLWTFTGHCSSKGGGASQTIYQYIMSQLVPENRCWEESFPIRCGHVSAVFAISFRGGKVLSLQFYLHQHNYI